MMNIALAIMYLYPTANPTRDFTVQDNGPEPVLRKGAEEKVVSATKSDRQKSVKNLLRALTTATASTTIF